MLNFRQIKPMQIGRYEAKKHWGLCRKTRRKNLRNRIDGHLSNYCSGWGQAESRTEYTQKTTDDKSCIYQNIQ